MPACAHSDFLTGNRAFAGIRPVLNTMLIWALFQTAVFGQTVYGMYSKWADDLTEWIFYTGEDEGDLRILYMAPPDLSTWTFQSYSLSGQIGLKWRNDPSQWELRGNSILFARVKWPGDLRTWTIHTDNGQFDLSMKYGNVPFEWTLHIGRSGRVNIYMEVQGDPRSWHVEYDLLQEVDAELVLFAMFLAMYHSVPW